MLRSVLHDCLFLNWALPVEQLAPPPSPLRYQPHLFEGRSHTFASLLLCHRDAPLPGLPPSHEALRRPSTTRPTST